MKPAKAAAAPHRAPLRGEVDPAWSERAGRLFTELERPARLMVRRAFRSAFSDHEIDDIYSSAWVGALRALAGRHRKLSDDEIRSYLLTAVANQASKELRRRRRKPAAPLELVGAVPDSADTPDERATRAEDARLTRDLLASLPPRRRAVIMLRYGWGLEPRQVCGLVTGLSPRAYRKEITKGVDELVTKMKAVDSGEWCAEREPVLKAYAAGLADADQARQAQAHISHCRSCSEFVARLSGHLHHLGGAIAASGAIDGLDGHISLVDRALALGDRARELAGGLSDTVTGVGNRVGTGGTDAVASHAAMAGGTRGAGAAGAGILAKLAGLGAAGKIAVACIGGGAAATACIAAGVAPIGVGGATAERPDHERPQRRSDPEPQANADPRPPAAPVQLGSEHAPPVAAEPASSPPPQPPPADQQSASASEPESEPEPRPEPTDPVAPSTPPVAQEFEVAAAAQPVPEQTPTPTFDQAAAPASGGGGGGGASGSAVRQEFGP